MNKLRHKMKGGNLKILGIPGYGYRLIPAGRKITKNQMMFLDKIGRRGGVIVPPHHEADWLTMIAKNFTVEERIEVLKLTRLEDPLCAL